MVNYKDKWTSFGTLKVFLLAIALFVGLIGLGDSQTVQEIICRNFSGPVGDSSIGRLDVPTNGGCKLPDGYITALLRIPVGSGLARFYWESFDADGELIGEKQRDFGVPRHRDSNFSFVLSSKTEMAVVTVTHIVQDAGTSTESPITLMINFK